jgi:CRP-like cAMP-binding protein
MSALPREELRGLFLFEHLSEDQLDWVATNAVLEQYEGDTFVIREGDEATCFYVILSGPVRMTRLVSGTEVETNRSDQRGAYFGATQFFVHQDAEHRCPPRSSPSSSAGGSRWPRTCWKACTSAGATATP